MVLRKLTLQATRGKIGSFFEDGSLLLMHNQTTEALVAELDRAWQIALAKQDAMAMCEATWKKRFGGR